MLICLRNNGLQGIKSDIGREDIVFRTLYNVCSLNLKAASNFQMHKFVIPHYHTFKRKCAFIYNPVLLKGTSIRRITP